MDWTASTSWWLASGALVAVELATGTFYLLMVAVGLVAAAVSAHLGASAAAQVVVAAVVGGGATALCRLWQSRRNAGASTAKAGANPDVNLDIGGLLPVTAWDAEGCARARYRGTDWNVVYRGVGPPQPGEHRIVELVGNRLVVSPVHPAVPKES